MARRSYVPLTLAAALILMLACVPSLGFAPTPLPTFDPNAPLTAIAETAGMAATQTAVNLPPTETLTPTATQTPTVTPTFTPTFFFIVVTNTVPPTQIPVGSTGKEFDCQVLSVDPADNSQIAVNAIFTVRWTVVNIGKASWDTASFDYHYAAGKRIYRQSIYDFPATTSPGSTVELTAEMQAPSEPGSYTTTWNISMGNNWFCPMNLTIEVN